MRQKEFDHFFSFVFGTLFGHFFSVTFSDASITFFVTFFAKLFLRQASFFGRVRKIQAWIEISDRDLIFSIAGPSGTLARFCPSKLHTFLEAQQRYFSYRAILVAIVSQNSFVHVFMGYRTIIGRYVAKWGIAQMCLCKIKYQGGGIAPFWGNANLP